ncbi:MAG: sugar transferase [Prevotellaceae bacterium]|nr:sugar transferase [Prevotellaceae bacterium]
MEKTLLRYRYIVSDFVAAFLVWVAFMYFRQIVNDNILFENVRIFIPKYNFISSIVVYPFVCLFVHWLSGIYLHPMAQTGVSVFLATVASSVVISFVIFFALMLDDVVVTYEYYYYSLLVLLGLNIVIILIFRLFIVSYVKRNFKTKKWAIDTAIIGLGENARKISRELAFSTTDEFAGFISPNGMPKHSKEKILGSFHEIGSLIDNYQIKKIIIALDSPDDYTLFSIINKLFNFNIEISFTPRINEIITGSAKMNSPKFSPLVSVTHSSMSDWQVCVKRFCDILFSIIALIICTLPMIAIAIAIKKDSSGSVFFRQERIGRYGVPFKMLKFRTMRNNAENGLPQLSNARDERITKIGYFLRKYRLDEIPQFINILRGEMSLVGPRPERAFFIKKITEDAPYYCLLYRIQPGLTSWGPIRIGYSDTIEKMIERLNYDIIYMDNMSLFVDMKILIYTFEIIFKGKGV